NASGTYLGNADVYTTAAGAWSPAGNSVSYTFSASPGYVNYGIAPKPLGNGKVLAAGGYFNASQATNGVSLFDPATNKWSPAASMTYDRLWSRILTLNNGDAIAIGGCSGACSSTSQH